MYIIRNNALTYSYAVLKADARGGGGGGGGLSFGRYSKGQL